MHIHTHTHTHLNSTYLLPPQEGIMESSFQEGHVAPRIQTQKLDHVDLVVCLYSCAKVLVGNACHQRHAIQSYTWCVHPSSVPVRGARQECRRREGRHFAGVRACFAHHKLGSPVMPSRSKARTRSSRESDSPPPATAIKTRASAALPKTARRRSCTRAWMLPSAWVLPLIVFASLAYRTAAGSAPATRACAAGSNTRQDTAGAPPGLRGWHVQCWAMPHHLQDVTPARGH